MRCLFLKYATLFRTNSVYKAHLTLIKRCLLSAVQGLHETQITLPEIKVFSLLLIIVITLFVLKRLMLGLKIELSRGTEHNECISPHSTLLLGLINHSVITTETLRYWSVLLNHSTVWTKSLSYLGYYFILFLKCKWFSLYHDVLYYFEVYMDQSSSFGMK